MRRGATQHKDRIVVCDEAPIDANVNIRRHGSRCALRNELFWNDPYQFNVSLVVEIVMGVAPLEGRLCRLLPWYEPLRIAGLVVSLVLFGEMKSPVGIEVTAGA